MKLGLLGDIHAEDERLAAALSRFRAEGVERVLFVGDVVDGLGDVDRCCALLASAVGVRGNHDRWLLEGSMRVFPDAHVRENLAPASVALLESLPAVREIDLGGEKLLLCHGVGENDMQRLTVRDEGYALETMDALVALIAQRRYAIVVGGHTHERMVRKLRARDLRLAGEASLVFVNPGTLARDATPCAAVLDWGAREVRYFELEDPERPTSSETVAIP